MSLRGNGLSQRVARRILGITVASLIAACAMLAGSAWRDETKRLENLVAQIEEAFAPPLSESLWLVDLPQAESQMRAMTKIEGIAHVSVKLFTGQQFRFTAAGVDDGRSAFLVRHATLRHDGHPVATLELAADRRVLVDTVVTNMLQMLFIQALLLALGGYVLFRSMNREATRPLENAATQLSAWRPGDPALSLATPGGGSNEMATLNAAFGRMQATLADHLARQQALQTELAQHRDRLAELATTRGHSLSYLEGLEHRALTMSTGLISLPCDMIAPQISRSLADICRYAGLDFAGLLEPGQTDAAVRLETFWESAQSAGLSALPAALQNELGHWVRLCQAARGVEIMAGLDAADPEAIDARAAFARLGYRALIAIPLQVRDSHHGILILARTAVAPPWPEQEIAYFQLVGQIVASALAQHRALQQLEATRQDLETANAELDRMSRTDPLTGLDNRRAFDAAHARELSRARRGKSRLALVVLDVDHFKDYNDTLGHAEGDVCLAVIAALLREAAQRPADVVARIGGEEFALLLPDTGAAGAKHVYAKLRQALCRRALPHPASPVGPLVTLSAGIAEYDTSGDETFKDFFVACDTALYAAKHGGRDRCVVAERRAVAAR
ncbi:MAG: sensor domain-containing diguanylate cyclase [Sulfuritalea sp.]|nr:sensor domain-containing diguanylate cyclase [Sulfuritalea sp.]MDP1981228.1 sensor domain-containing diguanylate cyclase [Sulfuritalea sp.]